MAKLKIDFSKLLEVIAEIADKETDFSIDLRGQPMEPIDIQLRDGLEVSLDEINYDYGLLSHQGRQILLYIKDQGGKIQDALEDGSVGKKYHVADCRTLVEMRQKNRFDRYVVTNSLSGDFKVSGVVWRTQKHLEGTTRLSVCKNCLQKLNYKGYNVGGKKTDIFNSFSMNGFFKTYSSHFKYLPRQTENDEVQYTEDWPLISGRVRAERKFKCEQCEVDLKEYKHLLHTHHKNGVKSDNRNENLIVLCADCHRKQDLHGHMFVTHDIMQQINSLRRQQSIGTARQWNEALEFADPSVEGLLLQCKAGNITAPEVGYDVTGSDGAVVTSLELAWPEKKIGVAVSEEERSGCNGTGWTFLMAHDVLDNFPEFKTQLQSLF